MHKRHHWHDCRLFKLLKLQLKLTCLKDCEDTKSEQKHWLHVDFAYHNWTRRTVPSDSQTTRHKQLASQNNIWYVREIAWRRLTSPLGSFSGMQYFKFVPHLGPTYKANMKSLIVNSLFLKRHLIGSYLTVLSTPSCAHSCSLLFKGDVTRDDSQQRFLEQHSVAMLEQCCNHSKQCRNNVATLCCARNRRCESSRVTSP